MKIANVAKVVDRKKFIDRGKQGDMVCILLTCFKNLKEIWQCLVRARSSIVSHKDKILLHLNLICLKLVYGSQIEVQRLPRIYCYELSPTDLQPF